MPISIQTATMDNLEKLYEIERECFTRETYSRIHIAALLLDPNCYGFIAKLNGEVAGFIIGSIHATNARAKAGHVYTLDVVVRHRREGVGSSLLEALERVFAEKNVEFSYLEARLDNAPAVELYLKHGYTKTDTLSNYYENGAHAIRLRKALTSRTLSRRQ